jgi:hypothetical protein
VQKITLIKELILEEMEEILFQWTEYQQQQCAISLPTITTQATAKCFVENLNAIQPDKRVQSLTSTAECFQRLHSYHGYHSIQLIGKAVAAHLAAA